MSVIPNTCRPSLTQGWENGLGTLCLGWPCKFTREGLVNDHCARKAFRSKGERFVDHLGFLCALQYLSYSFLKSVLFHGNNMMKLCHGTLRPIKTKFNEKPVWFIQSIL